MILRLLIPFAAWLIGRCLRFDAATMAGFVLVGATPVGFSPLLAVASGHVYLELCAAVSCITSILAFLTIPAIIHAATAGASSTPPLLLFGLISFPFTLGMSWLKALPGRHAALLGRLSIYLTWLFSLPQLLTVVRNLSRKLITRLETCGREGKCSHMHFFCFWYWFSFSLSRLHNFD